MNHLLIADVSEMKSRSKLVNELFISSVARQITEKASKPSDFFQTQLTGYYHYHTFLF